LSHDPFANFFFPWLSRFLFRGSRDDKIHFVFNMYDVSHDNTVSKQELTTLLNHIPKEAFETHSNLFAFERANSHPPTPGGGFGVLSRANSIVSPLSGGSVGSGVASSRGGMAAIDMLSPTGTNGGPTFPEPVTAEQDIVSDANVGIEHITDSINPAQLILMESESGESHFLFFSSCFIHSLSFRESFLSV
jgi:hypothetical protein